MIENSIGILKFHHYPTSGNFRKLPSNAVNSDNFPHKIWQDSTVRLFVLRSYKFLLVFYSKLYKMKFSSESLYINTLHYGLLHSENVTRPACLVFEISRKQEYKLHDSSILLPTVCSLEKHQRASFLCPQLMSFKLYKEESSIPAFSMHLILFSCNEHANLQNSRVLYVITNSSIIYIYGYWFNLTTLS